MQNDQISVSLAGQYIDTYLPAIDGVIVTVQNYARWLTEDHFPCYVAAAKATRGYVDHEPYQIIRYNSVPIARHPPYRFGVPLLDRKFLSSQLTVRPDLVHAHSPFTAGAEALRISRKLNIPLVASFHSKYYDDILHATGSKLVAEYVVDVIVDFYNKVDCVWTVNSGTAGTLRDYGYKKPIEIMPNGTEFTFPADAEAARKTVESRFNLTPDEPMMLFVGQHIVQKNLPMLLDAVGLYAKTGAQFKLLMVGDGLDRKALEEQAANLGLGDRVIFAGVERDREKLSAIYLRADLFTFPSIYDNAPLVIREAAMAGCPSVMIAGSNAAEDMIDGVNAYLCEDSAASLCQTIARALGPNGNHRQIGQAARQTLVKPWREVVQMVAGRYQTILQEYRQSHNT